MPCLCLTTIKEGCRKLSRGKNFTCFPAIFIKTIFSVRFLNGPKNTMRRIFFQRTSVQKALKEPCIKCGAGKRYRLTNLR